jgi:hypothetical protein
VEILYFTAAGMALYVAADWVLRQVERRLGHPLKYRSVVFFVILSVMAVSVFNLISALTSSS